MRTEDDPMSDDDATSTSSETDGVIEGDGGAPDAPLEPFSEVLSGVMDEHDSDSADELELPEASDDLKPHPAKSDPGFDGWLDDADPYAALTDDEDDAAAEIADWVAFTNGAADDLDDGGETDVVVDVTDTSVGDMSIVTSPVADEPSNVVDVSDVDDEPHEDTIEFFLDEGDGAGDGDMESSDDGKIVDDGPVSEAAIDEVPVEHPEETVEDDEPEVDEAHSVVDTGSSVESDAVEEAAEPEEPAAPVDADEPLADESDVEPKAVDPDELMVLPVVPIAASTTRSGPDGADASPDPIAPDPTGPDPIVEDATSDEGDDDDTGDVPIVGGGAPFEDATDLGSDGEVFDFSDFDDDDYKHKPTREHQDLAAAMVAADSQDTAQVALSAAIPGLESGVVGFDDVVAAGEGDAAIPAPPKEASNLLLRVGTGVALVAAFLLSLLWRPAITVLALAAFVVAAGEFYSALMHRRFKPMSVFGFIGIIAAGIGAVVWGVVAIPIAFGLLATVILLYGAVSQRRVGAVSGFALTVLVAGWIGGFGSFAFPIIAAEDYQLLVLTVVAIVALVDIAAYFVGSSIGRRPFAPTISPKKTVEGFVGGTFMAFLAGAGASFFIEAIDLPTGLVLGAVVAVFAPLGDLAVSVAKRSLDIKDMGSILPGHGGLLDRIDAIIAVVPAAWAVFVWAGLL
ncbi:MAG: phosphatidate cytidylyltransferase [Acidimicrobiia bacterium]